MLVIAGGVCLGIVGAVALLSIRGEHVVVAAKVLGTLLLVAGLLAIAYLLPHKP